MIDELTRFLICIGAAIGVGGVYAVKVWDELADEAEKKGTPLNKGKLWRNALYYGFGSGLLCLLGSAVCLKYFHLDFWGSVLIGAGCGFLGAKQIKNIALRFIASKLGVSQKGGENE